MSRSRLIVHTSAALVAAAFAAAPVAAQSIYAGLGTTGATLGYAHAYSPQLGARAEVSLVPTLSRSFEQDGIDYSGEIKSTRFAALADWHPFSGVFRLSAGLSGGKTSGSFAGAPSTGTSITIGGTTVGVGPADRYDSTIEFPSAMPYLGLGWGHTPAKGWGAQADVGLLIGTPKVTGSLSPSLSAKIAATGGDPQAELERELQTVRDTTAKVVGLPVLSVGVSYRW
ncbi:MAG: hypothetical protein EHM87_02650 [Burkholderiales bacterium]|nr:MAG: hypothetical protein EHM87_02650 [Burkholderiales bacterium]